MYPESSSQNPSMGRRTILSGTASSARSSREPAPPLPARPANCGDCIYMIPRAKVYKRETIEDLDGVVHYLCQQRWIEITPYSPWCELGKSKTRTTTIPT